MTGEYDLQDKLLEQDLTQNFIVFSVFHKVNTLTQNDQNI